GRDGASGTTRWNSSHNSSGTNRSTIPTTTDSLPNQPNEMTSNTATVFAVTVGQFLVVCGRVVCSG
ncbi:hypothetical protein, partial [Streptomyces chryseus]|uniref:hypothetical protein n=1 Tax=Streptomyces chryseus TaxID=68186 RepID=UPI001ABFFACA